MNQSPYLEIPRPIRGRIKTAGSKPTSARRANKEWDNSPRPVSAKPKQDVAPEHPPATLDTFTKQIAAASGMDLGSVAYKEYSSVAQWKRSALLLVRQLYRAKFIFGEVVEQLDPMASHDNAGDLHVDDVPAELLEQVVAGEEDLAARLRTAEGVIRKLYSRSMQLTQENAALKEENERLKELARPRPHSAQGQHDQARPSSARNRVEAAKAKAHAAARAEVEELGAKGVRKEGSSDGRDGAKSAPLEPTEVWKLKAAAKQQTSEDAAALEALAPGQGTQERLKMLEEELRHSRRREELAKAEVERMRKLEILMWDKDQGGAGSNLGGDVVRLLRARLESARGMLATLAEQLSAAKEENLTAAAAAAAAQATQQSRLGLYLRHRNSVMAALALVLNRFPSKQNRTRESSDETKSHSALTSEQQSVLVDLRANAAAVGELSNSMLGSREEAEEEEDESDEEDRDPGFTTSNLVRSCELIALHLSPDAREELLAMMQDVYHRFHLVKMEVDAQSQTERELREVAESNIRQLLMERAALRGALADLLHRVSTGGEGGGSSQLAEMARAGSAGDVALMKAQAEMEAIMELEDEIAEEQGRERGDTERQRERRVGDDSMHGQTEDYADEDEREEGAEAEEDDDNDDDDDDDDDVDSGDRVRADDGSGVTVVERGDGSLYEGEGEGGVAQGVGAETYPDGSVYEGQFHAGLRHGLGAYFFANGMVYEGQWQDGVRHGYGLERPTSTSSASEPNVVHFAKGGLLSRAPLSDAEGEMAAEGERLQMDVLDCMQAAREAARSARLGDAQYRHDDADSSR